MIDKFLIDRIVKAISRLNPEELKELREKLKDLFEGEPSSVGAKPKTGPPSLDAGAEAVIGTDLDGELIIPSKWKSKRIK
jgi:hypothetical protein